MAPKTAKAAASKKTKTEAAHPTYQDMIKMAIIQLKDRQGSSRQALKKYVLNNNNLGNMTDATFTSRFNQALSKGSESGVFDRPKGPSGPVKLGKGAKAAPEKKAPTEKKVAAPKKDAATKTKTATAKKPAAKASAPKAAAATKKTATKAAPKKTAATKANTSKPRKTAPAAPAVENKEPVLGKTKSGRVTKNKAEPATKKAAATKKAKAAPAKKAATPKKA